MAKYLSALEPVMLDEIMLTLNAPHHIPVMSDGIAPALMHIYLVLLCGFYLNQH